MTLARPIDHPSASLNSIQVLRAIAAFGVVFEHVWQTFGTLGLEKQFPNFVVGTAGVDLFFAISGFIMVYVSEPLFGQTSAPALFLSRRIIRIVPLYWVCTTIWLTFLIVLHKGLAIDDLSWQSILGTYFFLPVPRPSGGISPVLMVGWTLNYEMYFYCVFAVATVLPRRVAVLAVTAFLATAVALPTLLGAALPGPIAFYCSPNVFEFVFGMWIALAFREGFRVPLWLSCGLIAAGVFLIMFAGANNFANLSKVVGWGGGAAMVLAAFVLGSVKWPRWAPLRVLVTLGDASYALYLLHIITMAFIATNTSIAARLGFVDPGRHVWLYAAILVLASVAVALAAHMLFERPFTAFLRRRFEPRPQAAAMASDVAPVLPGFAADESPEAMNTIAPQRRAIL